MPTSSRNKIFVCYDSDSGKNESAILAARLKLRFGRDTVFHDTDLVKGDHFPEQLTKELKNTHVLLVVVTEKFVLRNEHQLRNGANPDQGVASELYAIAQAEDTVILPLYAGPLEACHTAWRTAYEEALPNWINARENRPLTSEQKRKFSDATFYPYPSLPQALSETIRTSQEDSEQTELARRLAPHIPSRQSPQHAHDFNVYIWGDIVRDESQDPGEYAATLNLLARALRRLEEEVLQRRIKPAHSSQEKPRLKIHILDSSDPRFPGDVKNLVDNLEWWIHLRKLAEPTDSEPESLVQFIELQGPTPSPWDVLRSNLKNNRSSQHLVCTFGLHSAHRKKFDGLLDKVYWLGFPTELDRNITLSCARAKDLSQGKVSDATTHALAAFTLDRLEQQCKHLANPGQRTADRQDTFTDELFGLLRDLACGPLPRPRRGWLAPLVRLPGSALFGALVVWILFPRPPLPPPPALPRPPDLKFCGGYAISEEYLKEDLQYFAARMGYEIEGNQNQWNPCATPTKCERMTLIPRNQNTGSRLTIEILKSGSKLPESLLKSEECDIGVVSDWHIMNPWAFNSALYAPVAFAHQQFAITVSRAIDRRLQVPSKLDDLKLYCKQNQSASSGLSLPKLVVRSKESSGTYSFLEHTICGDNDSFNTSFLEEHQENSIRDILATYPNEFGFASLDEVASNDALRIVAEPSEFQRDIYYIQMLGTLHSPTSKAFIDLVKENRELNPPAFLACGSTSIGREYLEHFLSKYVQHVHPSLNIIGPRVHLQPQRYISTAHDPKSDNLLRYEWDLSAPQSDSTSTPAFSTKFTVDVWLSGSESYDPQQHRDCSIWMDSSTRPDAQPDGILIGEEQLVAIKNRNNNSILQWHEVVTQLCHHEGQTASHVFLAFRNEQSGTRRFLEDSLCGMHVNFHSSNVSEASEDNEHVARYVAGNEQAIGFVPLPVYDYYHNNLQIARINEPFSNRQKLRRQLRFYLRQNTSDTPAAKAFLDYFAKHRKQLWQQAYHRN